MIYQQESYKVPMCDLAKAVKNYSFGNDLI